MTTTRRSEPIGASRLVYRSTLPTDVALCKRCGIPRIVKNDRPTATGLCRDCAYVLTTEEKSRWAA